MAGKSNKIGLMCMMVCSHVFADPFVHPSIRNEGCVAKAPLKMDAESSAERNSSSWAGRHYYHALLEKMDSDKPQLQTARVQPYFSGFCNPALPSSCPQ